LIAGKKIKAALLSDINKSQIGTGRNRSNKMEEEGEKENFEKKMSIDEDKKRSIIERIRKNI